MIDLRAKAATLMLCLAIGTRMLEAQTPDAGDLLEMLKISEPDEVAALEKRIIEVWSNSGSAAMNLLFQRGHAALERRDYAVAIEHFSALTDHAPEFAEGWNARATTFYLMGRNELSIADIATTLSLNPKHFGAITGLAMILERMGDHKNALQAYQAVREISPNRKGVAEAIKRLEEKVFSPAL